MSLLLEKLKKTGAIPLSHFMSLASIAGNHGFYQKNNPFLQDFITAPKVNSVFSEMIAMLILLTIGNNKEKFALLELGAGDGTMIQIIAQTLQKFSLNFDIYIYEKSELLQKIQQKTLQNFSNITWIHDLYDLPQTKTIVIANEFFDALPIDQFIFLENQWFEMQVAYLNNELQFVRTPIHKKHEYILPKKNVKNTAIIEISWQSLEIINLLSKHVMKNDGAMLIIDYGYREKPWKSTLRAIKKNQFVNFFDNPGESDLSSSVDFTALMQSSGLSRKKCISQNEFLQNMGIKERIQQLSMEKDQKLQKSINFLLNMDNFLALIMQKNPFNY